MTDKRDSRWRPGRIFRLSDEVNKDEAEDFISHEIGQSQNSSDPQTVMKRKARSGHSSTWLRQCGLTCAVLLLAFITINSYTSLLRRHAIKFGPSIASDHAEYQDSVFTLDLHPEDHVFRQPRTITYHWNISSGFRSPDGVKKLVYLVNGVFPGPTIECRSGDKLVIHVTNALPSEGVSLHWHGLHMRNYNWMDGAVGFTQCPIPSSELFTYEFKVEEKQSGTFWWHAHSQVQRGDGLYGGLVVHKPETQQNEKTIYHYEKEVLLLVGDWYHRNAEEVLAWYTSARGFGNEPVPDSLLINGAGDFTCSMAVPARPLDCVDVQRNQSVGPLGSLATKAPVRIRVVNVGTLAGITIQITSATLTPIMLDGGFAISGSAANSAGILYPGERADMILNWSVAENYDARLLISLDPENFKYPNEALRAIQSFPLFPNEFTGRAISESARDVISYYDLASATGSLPSRANIPQMADQTILLYTKTQKLSINSNHPMGFINRSSWAPQSEPLRPLISLTRSQWDSNQLIPWIPLTQNGGSWVDIIINNLDDGSHPFHLHGHNFWILASYRSEHGWGSYSPFAAKGGSSAIEPKLNLINPLNKDTVSIPRRGYAVIRLWANNPGIWMFHCHVLFHQASGMAMGFQVGGQHEYNDIDVRAASLCVK